jgi:hypothetical protein
MPHSLAALTVQNPEVLHAALNRAQAKNIIARLDEATAAKAVEALQALSSRELRYRLPARAGRQLFDLVALSGDERAVVPKSMPRRVTSTQFLGRSASDEALRRGEGRSVAPRLRVQRAQSGHLPLVEKLAAHQEIKSLKDLASKGAKEWTAFLDEEGIAAPDKVPGKSPSDKRSNYALILARLVEDAFPTASFASGWIGDASLDKEVGSFFARNPGFAFEEKGVNTYLKERPTALDGVPDKAAATPCRPCRISSASAPLRAALGGQSTVEGQAALRVCGREWAGKVRREDGKTLAPAGGGHLRQPRRSPDSAVASRVRVGYEPITPYVIPKTDLRVNLNEQARATRRNLRQLTSAMRALPIRARSPAYLVDLLMFLDNATAANGDTGLEKLFARRRDIGNIKLNCENTKTVLPYLDLVNEVLEDAIVLRPHVPETYEEQPSSWARCPKPTRRIPTCYEPIPNISLQTLRDRQDAVYPWSLLSTCGPRKPGTSRSLA